MTTLTGVVTGQSIALDERVPELEGKRVRVLVEPADETSVTDQAGLLQLSRMVRLRA